MALQNKKELILINPRGSYLPVSIIQRCAAKKYTPHSLLTLEALTPKDYRVRIINQKIFWQQKDFAAGALVGITCLTSAVNEAYRLADNFRRAGSKVVLGGVHVNALPEEALGHADSVVTGEAESVWPQVISDFENGRLQKAYEGKPLEDFFTPAYDYFLHLDPLILSHSGIHIDRGCKYNCDFCARISKWLRFVKIEQVLELVKRLKKAKRNFFMRRPEVTFLCDNIYSNPSYAKELFAKLIPLKVTWAATCSIDIGFDAEALTLAKASGCRVFLIGFETIHPEDYRKTSLAQVSSADDYRVAIKNIKAHGIRIIGSFIIGLDTYGHLDYVRLLWFLMRSGLWHVLLAVLTPFPGSELFERLKQEKRILSFDWRKYNVFTCVIKPKRISVAGVYTWFFVIKYLSVFFTPLLFVWLVVSLLFWELGYRGSRYLFYGY